MYFPCQPRWFTGEKENCQERVFMGTLLRKIHKSGWRPDIIPCSLSIHGRWRGGYNSLIEMCLATSLMCILIKLCVAWRLSKLCFRERDAVGTNTVPYVSPKAFDLVKEQSAHISVFEPGSFFCDTRFERNEQHSLSYEALIRHSWQC